MMKMMETVRTMETVLMEKRGQVGYITLNRPEKHNALNHKMVAEVKEALALYNESRDIHVIVIRGAGKSFCSGYDMSPDKKPFTTVPEWRKEAVDSNMMNFGIWDSRKVVIASVHGYCMAGACDLMMTCDLTIASENAVFSEPELEFSTHNSFLVMPYLMHSNIAKYYLFTGERFGANEAQNMGLVNCVVPEEKLEEETYQLAAKLARLYSPAMEMLKKNMNMAAELGGMRNLMYISAECFAASKMQLSDVAQKFFAMAGKDGMQKAIRWRTAFFRDGEEAAGAIE